MGFLPTLTCFKTLSNCHLLWTGCSLSIGRAGAEKDSLFLTYRPKRKFSKPKYSFSQEAAFRGIVRDGQSLREGFSSNSEIFQKPTRLWDTHSLSGITFLRCLKKCGLEGKTETWPRKPTEPVRDEQVSRWSVTTTRSLRLVGLIEMNDHWVRGGVRQPSGWGCCWGGGRK